MLGPLGVLTTGLSRGGWGRDICATYPLMITSLQLVGGVGGGMGLNLLHRIISRAVLVNECDSGTEGGQLTSSRAPK